MREHHLYLIQVEYYKTLYRRKYFKVVPIPGSSAVITSLSISGFDDQFYFHGFLSERDNSIKKEFENLVNLKMFNYIFLYLLKNYLKNLNY